MFIRVRSSFAARALSALTLLAASWSCAGGRVQGGPTDDVTTTIDSVDDVAVTEAPDETLTFFDITTPDTAPDAAPLDAASLDAPPFDRALEDVPRDLAVRDRAANDLPVADRTEPPAPDIPPSDSPPPWDVRADACTGTLCAGACVDVRSDVRHCGGCGRACVTPPHVREGAVRCLASTCTFAAGDCEPGFGECDGVVANGCESDLHSHATCGGCAVACAEPTPACAPRGGAWACESSCATGLTRCAGACVATISDTNHCGACSNRCPSPAGGSAVCEAGRCGVVCNMGYLLVGGACVRAFCGAGITPCAGGVGCPPNSTCVAGGGCRCNVGFQATTCAGIPCASCPGVDFYCAPVFCGGGVVLCADGGYCPANSTCSPDSRQCLCNAGRRAVTCAGVTCTPCAFPNWRCL